ncbi:hypothetical protein AQI95_29115 [Streptomyces yokosukanensis]|uniref:Uncharacterized protein n=1 Tax=Streptomyces yokosukanensis TaxID=67386 RepID=A0A101NZG2_9ACTN|nr:hypothetical protein [Streptomyces yokosukanensis]KUN02133.1 hypothetical protein AQI95_29115 [Streptomyces yokosukanensis]
MSSAESSPPGERWRCLPDTDVLLDGVDADEEAVDAFYREIGVNSDMLVPLAEHHSADGVHSYWVLHDSAPGDHPGVPQYVALHLHRNPEERTFRFEHEVLPLPAMAQSWLIHRGCPRQSIERDPRLGPDPADEETRALERRLMGDGDHYGLGYSYTRDDLDDYVTVVALRALEARAQSPFRVVVDEFDTKAWTYTLREGGFATAEEAVQWCQDRLFGTAGSLPPVRPTTSSIQQTLPAKAGVPRPPGRSR